MDIQEAIEAYHEKFGTGFAVFMMAHAKEEAAAKRLEQAVKDDKPIPADEFNAEFDIDPPPPDGVVI